MRSSDGSAVSPVIGIILMVAISVALVALAASLVFDLGSDTEEPLQASITTSLYDGKIDVKVVRNRNIDKVFVRDIDGKIIESHKLDDGETISFTAVPTGGGIYQVVGVQNEREEIMRAYEIAAVRINMDIGGEITDDALFDIEHKSGDNIDAQDIHIWVDAENACGKSTRIVNLPVPGGDPRPEGSFSTGDDILDNSYNSIGGAINKSSGNTVYKEGETAEFSIAESRTECPMAEGDELTVSIVDITDNTPVIVGQADYTVTQAD